MRSDGSNRGYHETQTGGLGIRNIRWSDCRKILLYRNTAETMILWRHKIRYIPDNDVNLFHMIFNGLKTFITKNMLYAAGIL